MDSEFVLEENDRPYGIKHRCYYFARDIVLFVKGAKYDYAFSSMFSQLVRSATSIGANVVEGRSGASRKDWVNFMVIALKSSNETKYWLCLIRDTLEIANGSIEDLIREADEISKILASIILNSKNVQASSNS